MDFHSTLCVATAPPVMDIIVLISLVKETEDKAMTALSPYKMSGSLDYVLDGNMHSQQAAEPAPQTFVSLLEFVSEIYEGVNVGPSSGAPHAISSLNRQAGKQVRLVFGLQHIPRGAEIPGQPIWGTYLSRKCQPLVINLSAEKSTFLHTTGSSRLTTNEPDPSRVRKTDAQRSSAPVLLEVQAQPKEAHLSFPQIRNDLLLGILQAAT
ncbi:hypothetical protein Tco_0983080 [Tanacetum coccineum]